MLYNLSIAIEKKFGPYFKSKDEKNASDSY